MVDGVRPGAVPTSCREARPCQPPAHHLLSPAPKSLPATGQASGPRPSSLCPPPITVAIRVATQHPGRSSWPLGRRPSSPRPYRDTLPATHGTLALGPCFCPHRQPPGPRGISGISATLGPPIHQPLPGLAVFPEWPPPSPWPARLPSHADTLPPPRPHPSKWATPQNWVDKFHCNSYFPTSNCHSAMAHGLVSPAGLPPAPRQCHSSSQPGPTGHGLVLSWRPA